MPMHYFSKEENNQIHQRNLKHSSFCQNCLLYCDDAHLHKQGKLEVDTWDPSTLLS